MNRLHLPLNLLAGLLLFFGSGIGCQATDEGPRVSAVLGRQAEAWNRGDIEGFMATYWNSEDLTFISDSSDQNEEATTTRGWQATLDRYKERYPDLDAMGELTFSVQDVQVECDRARLKGRYHLDRKDDELTGKFVLDMKLIDGEWLIVKDHTTAD